MTQQKPLHEGLFTWPSNQPQMLGSRCVNCGETAFPAQSGCRACSGNTTEVVEIGNCGTLWTWTIQGFMPKEPYNSNETMETFQPYGVGYVEMPGGVRVESRIAANQREHLKIGMPLKLEIVPFRTDEDGTEWMTFQFTPAEENA